MGLVRAGIAPQEIQYKKFNTCERMSPAPTTAPAPTPPASTLDEADDEEQHNRADGGIDDQTEDSGAKMDVQSRQQPVANEGADNPDDQITDEPKSCALHDLTGQPPGNQTNQ